MKIDIKDRVDASLALQEAEEGAVDFDTQLAEAKASGKRFSIDVLPDGRKAIAYFTDAEAAHMAALPVVVRKKPWRQQLDDALARLAAIERTK